MNEKVRYCLIVLIVVKNLVRKIIAATKLDKQLILAKLELKVKMYTGF